MQSHLPVKACSYGCGVWCTQGVVARSSEIRPVKASWKECPHISSDGCNALQTAGRSGLPKSLQRLSSLSWMQRTPAGLPPGIPGMADEMDGAIQHAPHPTRHSMDCFSPHAHKTPVHRSWIHVIPQALFPRRLRIVRCA